MSARSKARKRALDLLYQADLRELEILTVLQDEALRAADQPERKASWNYAREIVFGVHEHLTEIDEKIQTYSVDWPIHRMPRLDRNIIRLASWEILFNSEISSAIAISEAVILAKEYSTAESQKFVNGILAKIAGL